MLKLNFFLIIMVFQIVTAAYPDEIYDQESIIKDGWDKKDYEYGSKSRKYANSFEADTFEKDDGDGESYGYRSKYKKTKDDDSNCSDEKSPKGGGRKGGACNKCGIAYGGPKSGRVINGRAVKPRFKYPWIVSLLKDNEIACGGALISASYVMTASHCVFNPKMSRNPKCQKHGAPRSCYLKPKRFKVGILGSKRQTPYERVAVRRIIGHPKYYSPAVMHDIALLKLVKPVRCGVTVMPVCLPTTDLHRIGAKLIIAGYGFNTAEGQVGPKMLREGIVTELDPKRCLNPKQPRSFYKNLVCAAGMESGQSSCIGDSGSALFGGFGNKFYAVGVTSFGSGSKCSAQKPVTYHKVHAALRFIKRHVKNLPRG